MEIQRKPPERHPEPPFGNPFGFSLGKLGESSGMSEKLVVDPRIFLRFLWNFSGRLCHFEFHILKDCDSCIQYVVGLLVSSLDFSV